MRKCVTFRGIGERRQWCTLDADHAGPHEWDQSYSEWLRDRVRAGEVLAT